MTDYKVLQCRGVKLRTPVFLHSTTKNKLAWSVAYHLYYLFMPKNVSWHFYSVQTSLSVVKVPRNSCLESVTLDERAIVGVINTSGKALLWDELISGDIANGSCLHRDITGQSFLLNVELFPCPLCLKPLKQAHYLTFRLEMFSLKKYI